MMSSDYEPVVLNERMRIGAMLSCLLALQEQTHRLGYHYCDSEATTGHHRKAWDDMELANNVRFSLDKPIDMLKDALRASGVEVEHLLEPHLFVGDKPDNFLPDEELLRLVGDHEQRIAEVENTDNTKPVGRWFALRERANA